ncbi:MAG: hypothetical protein MUP67_06600, partial [Acidimicrobiia bacterium]|nr:hypothetical protein [Acidimicrobiia bacterium]
CVVFCGVIWLSGSLGAVADAPDLLEFLTDPIDPEQLFLRSLDTLVRGLVAPHQAARTRGART